MYGPPEYPRATNSPTIIVLVAGLAAVLSFLLGVFVGFGAGESSAAPAPTVTVTAEDTDPASDQPSDPATGQPEQPTDPGPAQTGPAQTGPAQTGPAAPPTGTAGPAAPPTGTTGPAATMRTLVVGVDIQPGTYRTTGPVPGSTNCFWARLNSTSPSPSAVIDAGAPPGPATVTIQAADKAFQTAGCAQWTKA